MVVVLSRGGMRVKYFCANHMVTAVAVLGRMIFPWESEVSIVSFRTTGRQHCMKTGDMGQICSGKSQKHKLISSSGCFGQYV